MEILVTDAAFNTAASDHVAQLPDPTGSGVYIKALETAVRPPNAVHPHAPIGCMRWPHPIDLRSSARL